MSTEQNPSELVSRGVNVEGPQRERIMVDRSRLVVEERRQHWPRVSDDYPPTEMKESRKPTVLCSHSLPVQENPATNTTAEEWRLNPNRYSSWMHLVCIYARVVRALCNMQKANRVYRKARHPGEICDAEAITRKVQSEIFPEEYKALKNKKAISPKGPLIKLSPRIDVNGIIRMDGR